MDNILEKITLYDILGYLFPGSVLILMISAALVKAGRNSLPGQWSENTFFLNLGFFMISYLAGIALSEVTEWLQMLVDRMVQMGKRQHKKDEPQQETDGENAKKSGKGSKSGKPRNSGLGLALPESMEEQIISALSKSGIRENENTIRSRLQEDKGAYSQYMYGIIHNRSDCKRVHNYGSAYVMCKNIAAALFVGTVVMIWEGNIGVWYCAGSFFISVLFAVRGYRFMKKRDLYVMLCFVDRFTMYETEG